MEDLENIGHSKELEYQSRIADYEAQLVRLRSEVTRITMNYTQLRKKRYHKDNQTAHTSHQSDAATTPAQIRELKNELEKMHIQMHRITEELKKKDAKFEELQSSVVSSRDSKWSDLQSGAVSSGIGLGLTQASSGKWSKDLYSSKDECTTVGELTRTTLQEFAERVDKVLGSESAPLQQLLETTPLDQEQDMQVRGDHMDDEKQSSSSTTAQSTTQLVDNIVDQHIKQLNHDLLEVLDLTSED